MGLDMYLNKRTFVKRYEHQDEDKKVFVTVKRAGVEIPEIKSERVSSIVEEVMYWRKENHIHDWFVRNVQGGEDNCGEYYVSSEKLASLISDCKAVLADHKQAPVLLPTKGGFFFGSTDYDEGYFNSLEETIPVLESAMNEGGYGDIYYKSSW